LKQELKNVNRSTILSLICLAFCIATLDARSIQRTKSEPLPTVTTNWVGDNDKTFVVKNSHYEEYPIFKVFDRDYCLNRILPKGPISTRCEPNVTVSGEELSDCIEVLLEEIAQRKKEFTHFKLLTKKNFNRSKRCGAMMLKFKKYPFVLKLFIETPETFLNWSCKGIDNIWFFAMSGGANRHMSGLTRLRNLETIRNHIDNSPRWSALMDLPRKWFWLPKNERWIEINGQNIGPSGTCQTVIPGTYAIIADAIESDQQLSVFNSRAYSKLTLEFCSSLQLVLDAHLDNFMIEKSSGKMVIIDTEHFPSFVGFKDPYPQGFKSYYAWYGYLAQKFIYESFFKTKSARKQSQLTPHSRPVGSPIIDREKIK
jgi:hypothetical protein